MRRTEYLITELRNSTDNKDTNGIKDAEIIAYLNYGQKLIQKIVFKVNPKSSLFQSSETYSYSSSGEYTLPDDVFAKNAILKVEYLNGGKYYPIEFIDSAEYGRSGYWTADDKVVVQGFLYFDIKVTYFKALPKMDKRWGKVLSVTPGAQLALTNYDSNISTVDDYITAVDKFGAQVRNDIFIDAYALPNLSTTDALTGVTTSHYVCTGKNSVNASELPDECETYLLDYARQRLATRSVYTPEAQLQINFTDQQRADLAELFSNNQKDSVTLPITDFDSLDFE
jgi:hypothetical protein